jgi:hypothetical protein
MLLKPVEIIPWLNRVGLFKLGRRTIAAPCPPGSPTLTLVKFLPLAVMVFGKNRRSTIDPDFLSV